MPDDFSKQIQELTDAFNAESKTLTQRILEETERRKGLERIIEETERRITAEQNRRSTIVTRRTIRDLKARLARARSGVTSTIASIKASRASIKSLRSGFKLSIVNLLKGGAAGLAADVGLELLKGVLEESIWAYVEENYDKENTRRCVSESLETMLDCFGEGSWDLDRTKSQIRAGGKQANAHDLIQALFRRVTSFYDGYVRYDNQTTTHRTFARSWLAAQVEFFSELEEVIKKSTLEKTKDAFSYRYVTEDREVSKCLFKFDGDAYPTME